MRTYTIEVCSTCKGQVHWEQLTRLDYSYAHTDPEDRENCPESWNGGFANSHKIETIKVKG